MLVRDRYTEAADIDTHLYTGVLLLDAEETGVRPNARLFAAIPA